MRLEVRREAQNRARPQGFYAVEVTARAWGRQMFRESLTAEARLTEFGANRNTAMGCHRFLGVNPIESGRSRDMLESPSQMDNLSSISIEELVRLCAVSSSVDAWEEFVRRFHRLIASVVLRTAARFGDSSRQTVDDLIQETYLKLCADKFRILRNFEQQHPDAFLGYVKVLASNVVRDHFKASYSQKRGANQVEGIKEEFAPVAGEDSPGSPKAIERAVLIHEIRQHLAFCVVGPDQERNINIFWLHYRVGLSARAIADLPGMGLTTKGVESIIMRITRDLRERMTGPKHGIRRDLRDPAEGIMPAGSF